MLIMYFLLHSVVSNALKTPSFPVVLPQTLYSSRESYNLLNPSSTHFQVTSFRHLL